MPSDTTGYPPDFAALLDAYNIEVKALMSRLEAGTVSSSSWRVEMGGLVAKYAQAARMLGQNLFDLLPEELDAISSWLDEQLKYLDGFEAVINSAGGEYNPAWLPRAEMYGASTVIEYWEGKTAGLPLPAMPAQGTQCLCITTGESRIATMRGLVPIREIKVGDLVLTHLGRWKRVLATYLRMSRPNHRQAWVSSPWGTQVGCTSDHRFLTVEGWKHSSCIDNSCDRIYNFSHENILQIMRNASRKSTQRIIVPEMPTNLSLWQVERPSGRGVHFLREKPQGQNAMAGKEGWDTNGYSQSLSAPMEKVQRFDREFFPTFEQSRTKNGEIQTRRWSGEISLSLSVDLDQGQWTYPGGLYYPSYQRRSYRRPNRKFDVDGRSEAPHSPHDFGSQTQDGEWIWQRVYGENFLWRTDILDVPLLRENVSELSEEWDFRPQVLLTQLLYPGTVLFDIEVEDDHSFIVEGLVSHNSNCRCRWDIQWIDRTNGDADCFWRLDPAAESCQTCLTRSEQWNPVQIRGGMLQ